MASKHPKVPDSEGRSKSQLSLAPIIGGRYGSTMLLYCPIFNWKEFFFSSIFQYPYRVLWYFIWSKALSSLKRVDSEFHMNPWRWYIFFPNMRHNYHKLVINNTTITCSHQESNIKSTTCISKVKLQEVQPNS